MNNGQNPGFIPQSNQPQPRPAPNTFSNSQFQAGQATSPVFAAGNAIPQAGNNAVSNGAAVNNSSQRSMGMLVGLIIASVVAVTFIGLFIWMLSQYSEASTNVNGKIQEAEAIAVDENTKKLESEFAEREKSPYKVFAGPADYGELSFEYPKTWSVYVAQEADNGGDFEAYLNPDVVYPTNDGSINALRVMIKDSSYESVVDSFESAVESGDVKMNIRVVGGVNANVYDGKLPTLHDLEGICAVLKVRDKAILIQTDAKIFEEDFYKVLDSVSYKS